ncbi:uncharacterized protein BJ171DRAFT_562286 [Polychytrium aggregatum]|uniref:uncharacterized protein n=1 Tax=Polychytrium aggregatum TaxID=110093 RepID=UPI0022FF1419|nr:uncharacterized protein BJ171DRAFT_562286 [Polychytrium aggregatum]KAI9203365.1 hypothetical protein BJ171DRAFT_562286 [Polychytrium aggregatum]
MGGTQSYFTPEVREHLLGRTIAEVLPLNKPLVRLLPSDTLLSCLRKFRSKNISSAPICWPNNEFQLVDIVDICKYLLECAHGLSADELQKQKNRILNVPCSKLANYSGRNPTITVHERTTIRAVIPMLQNNKSHRLALVDSDGELLHIISQMNIVEFMLLNLDTLHPSPDEPLTRLKFYGTSPVHCLQEDATLTEAYQEMIRSGFTALPIININQAMTGSLSLKSVKFLTEDDLQDMHLNAKAFVKKHYESEICGEFSMSLRNLLRSMVVNVRNHIFFLKDGAIPTRCLKTLEDLMVLGHKLKVPFLQHLFRSFDPLSSSSLDTAIQYFHLRDLESADYRSAYHQLCDWFYGWNVSEEANSESNGILFGSGDLLSNNFADDGGLGKGKKDASLRMKRMPRDIDMNDSTERAECERIIKTFETLLGLSRRALKKYYLDIEEEIPRVGSGLKTLTGNFALATDPTTPGSQDVEKIWQRNNPSSDEGENDAEKTASDGEEGMMDQDGFDEVIKSTRKKGMVVRRTTKLESKPKERKVKSPHRRDSDLDALQDPQLGKQAMMQPEEGRIAGSPRVSSGEDHTRPSTGRPITTPGEAKHSSNEGSAELFEQKNISLDTKTGGFSLASKPGLGLMRKPDQEDVKKAVQRDINHVYVEVDHSTDYTLLCITNVIVILGFAELLGDRDRYAKFSGLAQELCSDFVSNTLKTVWILLHRELPDGLTLAELHELSSLKNKIRAILELRAADGRVPRFRIRKLYKKFTLLHELFMGTDIHLFPNFLVAHKEGTKCAQFSQFDPSIWLTGGYDCIIRINDLRPPHTCLSQYVGHKSIVTDVHFTKDDAFIVSSSYDRTVKVWNSQSASCEKTLSGHSDAINSSDVSFDSRYICSGSADCTIRIWDFNTGDCLATIKKHQKWVKVVRFSLDARYIASGGLDKKIYLWDMRIILNSRSITHTRVFENHRDYILDLALHRANLLLSTSRDMTVRLTDYLTGKELHHVSLAPSWACTVSFSSDAEYFATGSFDNNVLIFRTLDFTQVRQIRVFNMGIMCVRFPRDLSNIVVGTTEGFLQQLPL